MNIKSILVTLLVLKFLKSNEVRPLQPLNILPILVTLLVTKLLKSNEVRL